MIVYHVMSMCVLLEVHQILKNRDPIKKKELAP